MRRTILLTLIAAALLATAFFAGPARQAATAGGIGTGGPPIQPEVAVRSRAAVGAPLQLDAALTQARLLRSGDGRVDLAVVASAPALPSRSRFPLHIALVLDRSGSMAGEKLAQARQAAREMIRRLSGEDYLAVIAYDSTVDVLVPLSSVAERRAQLIAAVEGIDDRGGTNLGGGLSEGIRELQRMPSEQALHRVILISDGRANEGVTDPGQLNAMAERARRKSISISTMGVGLDYNEDLMMALADHGGGSYHFVDSATALAGIFSKELDSLFTTVAREMVLEVRPAAGVVVEQVFGYPDERRDGAVGIPLGDLSAGDRRTVSLALRVPHATLGLLPVVELSLRYRDAQHDGRPVLERLALQALITDDAREALQSEDRLALEQVETARAADTTRQAMVLYESGRVEEARALARQKASMLDLLSKRIDSKVLQQQSKDQLRLESDIDAAPAPSSSAGKGLLKESKARAWEQYRK